MSPARFLCAIPVEYHPQVSILCLPFNEKEITIKLSDIVSVLIVFDDKLPAMRVVVVGDMLSPLSPCLFEGRGQRGTVGSLCCVLFYIRRLAMTNSFCKADEVMNSPDTFRSCDLRLIRR